MPRGVSKAQIDFSLNGERQESEHLQVANEISDLAVRESVSNVAQVENVIFKLVNTKRNGGTHINGVDDVVNPKTGAVERIRLLSGVNTIWLKEQMEQGITEEYARQNQRSLTFPRGTKILRIKKEDTAALEFAKICNHNIGNPKRKTGSKFEFFEYDPQKQQKEALEREEFEIEMAIAAKSQPSDYMRKHAVYLGINMFDEFGIPKTEDGIRREYVVAAKRNPAAFKRSLESREVEVNYMIKKAMSDSKIDLGAVSGAAVWASNGAMICRIPSGVAPAEYLLELALTNSKEGKEFLQTLEIVFKG